MNDRLVQDLTAGGRPGKDLNPILDFTEDTTQPPSLSKPSQHWTDVCVHLLSSCSPGTSTPQPRNFRSSCELRSQPGEILSFTPPVSEDIEQRLETFSTSTMEGATGIQGVGARRALNTSCYKAQGISRSKELPSPSSFFWKQKR